MKDKISKMIELYESSYDRFKGVCVFVNSEVYDTDYASINLIDDTFYFEFGEDDIEDFKFKIIDIKDIRFYDLTKEITVSIVNLSNGDAILIHNL